MKPTRKWASIARVSATKNLKGCWLVNPDGERVATILDHALAGQIAAAMNLTTLEQRIRFNTDRAGYTKPEESAGRGALRTALERAKQKLALYRAAHSGEYVGGVEYTQLIREIDDALNKGGTA